MDIKRFQTNWRDFSELNSLQEEIPALYLGPKTQTYYRSKAFVSQNGINPLIAASAPVFFLVEKVKKLATQPDLITLQNNLTHEIKAFEHQAQARGYHSQYILTARYTLCLWVDEMLLSQHDEWQSRWDTPLLIDSSAPNMSSDQPFFTVLNRCLQDPKAHIDLLELFYLCLSLGYSGEYAHLEHGQLKLNEIRNHLFETIQQLRGEFSKKLEWGVSAVNSPSPSRRLRWLPILTGVLLLAVPITYGFLQTNLNKELNLATTLTAGFSL